MDIEKAADGTWNATCTEGRCQFVSAGWPTRELARERAGQHVEEHATGEAMPELADFLAAQEA